MKRNPTKQLYIKKNEDKVKHKQNSKSVKKSNTPPLDSSYESENSSQASNDDVSNRVVV
jgi:hypothetical protein